MGKKKNTPDTTTSMHASIYMEKERVSLSLYISIYIEREG